MHEQIKSKGKYFCRNCSMCIFLFADYVEQMGNLSNELISMQLNLKGFTRRQPFCHKVISIVVKQRLRFIHLEMKRNRKINSLEDG